jgi:hypothetical protein
VNVPISATPFLVLVIVAFLALIADIKAAQHVCLLEQFWA